MIRDRVVRKGETLTRILKEKNKLTKEKTRVTGLQAEGTAKRMAETRKVWGCLRTERSLRLEWLDSKGEEMKTERTVTRWPFEWNKPRSRLQRVSCLWA